MAVVPLNNVAHAQAQTDVRTFQIAAGPLEDALRAFTRQSGIQVGYEPGDVRGRGAAAVSGEMSAAEALSHLLTGTGLRYRFTAATAVRLERAPEVSQNGNDGTITLGPVRVQGEGSGQGGGTVRQPADTRGTYTVPVSSSATKLDLAIKDTPQVVSVLTRQRIEDQNLLQIADVMDQQPGITVERQGVAGAGRVLFRSRGFNVTNVMFDGVPTTGSVTSDFDLWGALDTAIYDRVEFVQGSTGLATGVGDPSGSVNFVRKRPTEDLLAEAKIHYGTWSRMRAEVDLAGPLAADGRIRGRIVGAHQVGDSWQDRVEQQSKTLYGIVEADPTDDMMLTAGLMWTKIRVDHAHPFGMSPGGVNYGTGTEYFTARLLGRSYNSATNWSFTEIEMLNPFAKAEWRFADDWRINVNYMFTKLAHERLYGGIGLGFYDVESDLAGFDTGHVDVRGQSHNVDVSLTGKVHLLGREHDVMAGFSGYWGRASNPLFGLLGMGATGQLVPISGWTPNYPMPTLNFLEAIGAPPDQAAAWPWTDSLTSVFSEQQFREQQYGGYVATRLRPFDGLSLILGARWNHWKRSGWNQTYNSDEFLAWFDDVMMGNYTAPLPPRNSRDSDFKLDVSGKITPYAGAIVDITRNVTAYASYTGISKINANPNTMAWYRDADGKYLPPITGNSVEIGVKASVLDDKLNIQLAGYRMKQKNVAYQDGMFPCYSDPIGGKCTFPQSPGTGTMSDGIEFSAMGQLTPRVNLSASYSYLRMRVQWRPDDEVRPGCAYGSFADYENASERGFGCPAHTVKLFGTWRPLDSLTIGGGLTWKSATRANPDAAVSQELQDALTQGSVTVVDLMARYRIAPHVTVSANVQNLFDKKYMTAMGYGNITSNGFWGAPRNMMVTLGFNY